MKSRLDIIAIVIACLALAATLFQSINFRPYNPAQPSFAITDFETNETYTSMRIYNNGTEMTYNIRLLLTYMSLDPTSPFRELAFPTIETIAELEPGQINQESILVPIGKIQLRTQTSNLTDYIADIWVSCKNFYPGLHFVFNVTE
jgi:hypothetical protein